MKRCGNESKIRPSMINTRYLTASVIMIGINMAHGEPNECLDTKIDDGVCRRFSCKKDRIASLRNPFPFTVSLEEDN